MLPANKETLLAMLKSMRERGVPASRQEKIISILKRLGHEVPPA